MQTYEEIRAWLNSLIGEGRRFGKRSDMARELGIYNKSHNKLYNILNLDKKQRLNASTLIEWITWMGARIQTPEDFEKTGIENYTVPIVVPRIHNANDMSFVHESRTGDFLAFQYKWLAYRADPASCVLFKVTEQAMQPTLNEGDMVLVDRKQTEIYSGKIYAIGVEDTVCLRRIEKRPGAIVLRSDNPEYANEVIEGKQRDEIIIIARVIWTSREF